MPRSRARRGRQPKPIAPARRGAAPSTIEMSDTFHDHFSSRSTDYARFRPTYPPELAAWLAGIAPSRRLALDCGCGNGQLSTLLAVEFAQVVATDASPQQIANATAHPRVSYRVAPAEHSGLDDASVDLVTAAQAAHWFDLDAFYREVRRVLRPGGRVALISYGITETGGAAGEVLADFYANVVGRYWPAERRHVETGYRRLPFPFDEIAAPAMAMRAQWSLDQLLGYVDTWSAVRQAEAVLGRAPYDDFAARLRAAWGAPEARREIRWPLALRVSAAVQPQPDGPR